VEGAAAAEEPSALNVNPAGVGFVDRFALMYFHQGQQATGSQDDGVYAATGLGPLALGLSMEWMRPGEGAPRYRLTKLALALTDGKSASAAIAWNWTASPDAALAGLGGFDLGLSWRPWRHLSLGAAALGIDAYVGGARQPVRYDLGLATRFLDDTYTLAVDLLADDEAKGAFRATQLAFGARADLRLGVGLSAQVLVPIVDEPGIPQEVSAVFAVSWNARREGLLGGGAALPAGGAWLVGARLSSEAYRAREDGGEVPIIDVDEALAAPGGLLGLLGAEDRYGALVRRLEEVREDAAVSGLVLVVDDPDLGLGRVEELRALVAAVREKKPVLVYLRGGSMKAYYLALAGARVASPPGATLFVNGIASSSFYLRDGLARLGVAFEVVRAGAYKTAPEPLTRTGPSPEAREVTASILDEVYAREVAAIVAARGIPEAEVRALVDRGLFTSEEARDAKLVDAVLWPDEVGGWAEREVGRRARTSPRWSPPEPRVVQTWGRPSVIAVVPVEGMIVPGRGGGFPGGDGLAGAEAIGEAIRRAARDGEVRAIVLRVDSPGGDGLASDLIWREVMRARRRGKPVVVSMGDLAASGGYLVASAADAIVAEPSTLTGSIGVFALKPDLSALLGKLSVRREATARGENAQVLSLTKPWTPSERAAVERQIQAFYRTFLDRVAEGRSLPRAEVERIAGGRVWTGQQAVERRLVDRIGTVLDAVALAREKAGLAKGDHVEVRRFAPTRGALEELATGVLAAAAPQPALLRAVSGLPEVRAAAALAEMGTVVALPPEWLEPVSSP
jgi:protease-4